MSAVEPVGQELEIVDAPGPTMAELLIMATDIVAMVDGRIAHVGIGQGVISVHVDEQAAAEYLALRLCLGRVREYPDNEHGRGSFVVWSGGSFPEAEYRVFYGGEIRGGLRVFPYGEPLAVVEHDRIGAV